MEQSFVDAVSLSYLTPLFLPLRNEVILIVWKNYYSEIEMERRGGEKLLPAYVRAVVNRLPTSKHLARLKMSKATRTLAEDERDKIKTATASSISAEKNAAFYRDFRALMDAQGMDFFSD